MTKNGKQLDESQSTGEMMEEILTDIKEKGQHLLNEGLDSAKEIYAEQSKSLKKKASQLNSEKMEEISEDVAKYVRKNPWKGIVFAVGLGILLGAIFGPRD